jgi:hypothetical protein
LKRGVGPLSALPGVPSASRSPDSNPKMPFANLLAMVPTVPMQVRTGTTAATTMP